MKIGTRRFLSCTHIHTLTLTHTHSHTHSHTTPLTPSQFYTVIEEVQAEAEQLPETDFVRVTLDPFSPPSTPLENTSNSGEGNLVASEAFVELGFEKYVYCKGPAVLFFPSSVTKKHPPDVIV